MTPRAMIELLQAAGALPVLPADDPLMQALARIEEADAEAQPAPTTPSAASVTIARLRRANRRLSEHSEMLACALGACPRCWGHDGDCSECRGRGRPGHFLPDEACFDRFVRPALRRVLSEGRAQPPGPAAPGPGIPGRPDPGQTRKGD